MVWPEVGPSHSEALANALRRARLETFTQSLLPSRTSEKRLFEKKKGGKEGRKEGRKRKERKEGREKKKGSKEG
jgi:hypothetical protein